MKILIMLVLSATLLSGCTSYTEDDIAAYEDEISELESQLEEKESCIEELRYAIDEAESNLESGYYQDAYDALDGVSYCD